MGRELRRKQAKKEGKSLQREIFNEEHQIKKLIIITIMLVIIIGIIYLLSALFITEELDLFDKKDEETSTLITNTILASEIFKQKEEDYYVYFYNYDDEDEEISTTINSKLSESKVYKVDTNSALNKNYVSEESNKKANSLENLKVKASTVIKISGDKIVEYYENEEITSKLK